MTEITFLFIIELNRSAIPFKKKFIAMAIGRNMNNLTGNDPEAIIVKIIETEENIDIIRVWTNNVAVAFDQ
ncbi:MAG: hypothetical protein AB7V07_08685 [Candidatus Delongbacteria bacterium]